MLLAGSNIITMVQTRGKTRKQSQTGRCDKGSRGAREGDIGREGGREKERGEDATLLGSENGSQEPRNVDRLWELEKQGNMSFRL